MLRQAATRAVGAARSLLRRERTCLYSDFAYVKPGPVKERTHELVWNENVRREQWKTDGLPVFADGLLPHELATATGAWDAAAAEIEQISASKDDPLVFIKALRSQLSSEGASEAEAALWAAATAPITPADLEPLSTPIGRRAVIMELHAAVEALAAQVSTRAAAAALSGEADLSLPLPPTLREDIQRANSKDILAAMLTLARRVAIVSSALKQVLPPELGTESASSAGLPPSLLFGDMPTSARAMDAAEEALDADEVQQLEHVSSYDEIKSDMLAHRVRADVALPRGILPPPLHADAPSRELEDAARVVDANTSLTPRDKAYIMSLYSDALAGKADAFDIAAETAAIVDPQPQWGVYDPEAVTLEDDVSDALRGAGKFDRAGGYAVGDERVPPSSIGLTPVTSGNINTPMSTQDETAAAMSVYDANIAARVAAAEQLLNTAAVALGVMTPQEASASHPAPAAPQSFFAKHAAGERLPPPAPPLKGPRKEIPLAAAPAPPPAAAGKKGAAPAGKAGAAAAAPKKK